MFKLFAEVFNCIPLAACIGGRALVVHGGLFSRDGVKLDELRALDRFKQPGSEGEKHPIPPWATHGLLGR
jgi:serine/threonine-protein phosphatase 5